MLRKLILGLALIGAACSAQITTIPPANSGGGSMTTPASPLNSVQLNVSGSFGSDPTFIDYQNGIPDPTDAPVVTAVTTGTDAISYYIVEYTNAGQTNPSPTTTITNGNLSSLNVNITLPVESDPNITCAVVNATLGYSTGADELECDGSVINDTGPAGNLAFQVFGPPVTNTTAAVIAPRIGVSTLNFTGAAIYGTNTYAIATIDSNGNQLCKVGVDQTGSIYFYSDNASPCGNFGAANFWQQIDTCGGSAGGGTSPCQLGYTSPGIQKADTSAGDVTFILPSIASFSVLSTHSQGVTFTFHKPLAANSVTIEAADGTPIASSTGPVGPATRNSATSISFTGQNCSASFYWDLNRVDGLTGQWAPLYIVCPN